MAKVSVSYSSCSLHIVGMDMKCPLCGTLVKSGEKHRCSQPDPQPEQKAVKRG